MKVGNKTYFSFNSYAEKFSTAVWYLKIIDTNDSPTIYRKLGPAFISKHGVQKWYNKIDYHRIDYHRIDGPTIKSFEKYSWYFKGKGYIEEEYWNE